MDLDDEELEATRRLNGTAKESEIEEDIKILENWLKELDYLFETTKINNTKERNALRNVLAEREQDKERIEKLEEKNRVLCEEYCPRIAKIKDLIKNKTINISGFECIAVEDIEELLEDK